MRHGWLRHGWLAIAPAAALVAGAVLALLAPDPAAALTRNELPNGLVVLVEEDHSAPLVAVNAWVHAGRVNEPDSIAGLSHYLEHLTARGTEKRGPLEGRLDIIHLGGINSAGTWYDWTQYHNVVGLEHFEVALEEMADMLFNSRIDEAGVAAEEKVVSEEIRRRADAPTVHLFDEMMAITFPGHPYGDRVAGTLATTARATRIDFLDYYNATYVPNNIVLVVAGDIEAGAALRRVEEVYGAVPSRGGRPPRPLIAHRFTGLDSLALTRPVAQAYLALSFAVPGVRHPDRPAVELLAAILGGGASSRLARAAVEEARCALEVSASPVLHEGAGAFYISGTAIAPERIDELEAVVLETIAELREHGPTSEEVVRAARMLRLAKLFEGERVLDRAMALGQAELEGGVRYELGYLDDLARVRAEDLQRVARAFLVRENLKRGRLTPPDLAPAPPAVAGRRAAALERIEVSRRDYGAIDWHAARYRDEEAHAVVAPGAPRARPSAKPGAVTLANLDNGLRLLVREDHALPVVSAALVLAAGSAHDHAGREGGLTVLANTLTDGAGGRSREEIDALLDRLGGRWDLALDREFLRLGLTVAGEDLAEGIALLADLALRPALAGAEIEKERDLALAALRSARDRASWRAEERFRRAAYGDHAYAHPPEGTETGLVALAPADVRELHRELFDPQGAVLAIVGDVTAADARLLAEERFGGWAASKFETGILPLDFAAAPGGRYEEALDRQQVQILVGARGPARLAPGYVPCMVLRGVIGMRNFRELVYGLNLVYETRMVSDYLVGAGALALHAGTSPANREAVEREFAARIRAAREEPVPADELARIQTMLVGRRALEDEATGSLAASLARYEIDGRGFAYYDRLPELIRQVSAADVRAVAREVLAPERLITVVVGPATGGGAGAAGDAGVDRGAAGGAQ